MKVNKEEILGMYVALDHYIKQDHAKEWKQWEDQVAIIEGAAKKVSGVTTSVTIPPVANHTPLLSITWDVDKLKMTSKDLGARLRAGTPSIEVMSNGDNGINITVFMLKLGEEKIVAKRLQEELSKPA
jgi:seryl-tRNA(Sec) selenium transferase